MSKKKNKKQKRAFANPCAKGKFFPCQFGKKKAFSLVEVLVVIALVLMMTGTLFVSLNENKASAEAKVAANQLEATLRSLQNEAINGKFLDDQPICKFELSFVRGEKKYYIKYYNCSGTDPAQVGETKTVYLNPLKEENGRAVIASSSSSGTIIFNSPRGNSTSDSSIRLASNADRVCRKILFVTICNWQSVSGFYWVYVKSSGSIFTAKETYEEI